MNKKSIGLILLIGLVLRLVGILSRPIWYDEAIAIFLAEKGLSGFLAGTLTPGATGTAANVHPPAYFALLSGWIRVFGQALWSVRGLSILIGMLTLMMAYLLCRELFSEKTALIQTLFLAISPFHNHYSQEVRMYGLLALLTTTATYALWKGMRTGKIRWWVLLTFSVALGQYTQNLAVFYFIPLALIPVIKKNWKGVRSTVIACSAAIILYIPWLVQLPAQFAKVQEAYWTTRPGIDRIFTTLLTFVTNLPLSETLLPISLFIAILLIIIGLMETFREIKASRPSQSPGPWLAYLVFFPPILLMLFSQWQPIYVERALLPSGVMFSLWLGWALTKSEIHKAVRWALAALVLVGAGIGIYQHLTYQGFPYGPYQELGEYLTENRSPEDAIIHSNKLTMLPMVYYYRDLPHAFIADPPGSGSDTLALPTQETLGLFATPTVEEAAGDSTGVWLVIFARAIEEYQTLGYPTHPHITWLEEHYNLVSVEEWGDILLYRYEK